MTSKRRLNDMDAAHPKNQRPETPLPDLRQAGFAASSTILMALLLGGCSSVPDAANPMEWYRGATEMVTGRVSSKEARAEAARKVDERDYPDNRIVPERPKVLSPEERKDIANGLVADRTNARYTQDRINRDGTPTRPLAPKPGEPAAEAAAHVSEPTQPPPPRPASGAERPQPPHSRPVPDAEPMAARPAPDAPPQQVAQTRAAEAAESVPPAPGVRAEPLPVAAPTAQPVATPVMRTEPTPSVQPIPAPVVRAEPAPVVQPVAARPPSPVDDAFRRRLAQSAPATSVAAPLVEAPPQPSVSATQRIANATIEFSPGQWRLSETALADLEDLADAAIRSGSRIRVVANATPMAGARNVATHRADAVVRELRDNGIPMNRIDVSTGSSGDRVDAGLY